MTEQCNQFITALKTDLEKAIVSALQKRYISVSSHQGYTTGNAYQAVSFDGEAVKGYRVDRSGLFSAFDFSGKKVLDCGSNIGELSRLCRARGAVLVDGIEYDSYFVQIAQAINAYRGTTRVSFYQGHLTNPDTIDDHYDITLAFSVYPYVRPILRKIFEATSEILILETHNTTSDVKETYGHLEKSASPTRARCDSTRASWLGVERWGRWDFST